MPRPALGKVSVGDRMVVITPSSFPRNPDGIAEATVTKVSRVWVEMKRSDGNGFRPTTWRFRLDTQDDGKNTNYRVQFRTPEQHAWEEAQKAAWAVIREAKILPDSGSLWRSNEDRVLALADFIRTYDQEHPETEVSA